MGTKRRIPYGVINWAKLVHECFLVDNTRYIRDLELGRETPDAETVEQALAYKKALARRPDWNHEIAVTVVEVCGSAGYNWFDI